MSNHSYKIIPYENSLREKVIAVWEKSARATHHFVKPADMDYYKVLVNEIDFHSFSVYCLAQEDQVIGILGVHDFKVVMLFLAPDFIGFGFGKKLMDFAMNKLKADKVDVNEQNLNAVQFYSKLGFVTYDRMEKDEEGKDYPVLKMRLARELA